MSKFAEIAQAALEAQDQCDHVYRWLEIYREVKVENPEDLLSFEFAKQFSI